MRTYYLDSISFLLDASARNERVLENTRRTDRWKSITNFVRNRTPVENLSERYIGLTTSIKTTPTRIRSLKGMDRMRCKKKNSRREKLRAPTEIAFGYGGKTKISRWKLHWIWLIATKGLWMKRQSSKKNVVYFFTNITDLKAQSMYIKKLASELQCCMIKFTDRSIKFHTCYFYYYFSA